MTIPITLITALCAVIAGGGGVIWRLISVSPGPTLEAIRTLLDAHETVAAIEAAARILRLGIDNVATAATRFAGGYTRRICESVA